LIDIESWRDLTDAELRRAIVAITDAERERCAKIAGECRMTQRSFIGPLHGAGWNEAAAKIAAKIRENN
jgi:hypothetical protein